MPALLLFAFWCRQRALQSVSQSTIQSPSTEYLPLGSTLPLGYPSIQTGNQAVIHPASSHKYLLCFQVATVENIRREKKEKRNNNKNYKMLLLHYLWVAISLAPPPPHLILPHYPPQHSRRDFHSVHWSLPWVPVCVFFSLIFAVCLFVCVCVCLIKL